MSFPNAVYEEDLIFTDGSGERFSELISENTVGAQNGFYIEVSSYSGYHYSGFHKDQEVIYIISGQGVANVDGKDVEIKESCALYIPPGVEHYIKSVARPVKALCIHSR